MLTFLKLKLEFIRFPSFALQNPALQTIIVFKDTIIASEVNCATSNSKGVGRKGQICSKAVT